MKMKPKLSGTLISFILVSLLVWIGQVRADPYPQGEPPEGPLISMDFQNADMKDVLKVFSQQAGLNFIAGEKVKERKVTLYLDKVTVQDALNNIMEGNYLTYEQAEDSDIFIVRELEKPEVETVTQVFTLKYARVYRIKKLREEVEGGVAGEEGGRVAALKLEKEIEPSDIVKAVEGMLTGDGMVSIDVRTNSIIVKDRPYNMRAIEGAIAALDVEALQVMVEVEVLETSIDTLKRLGIEWGDSTGQLFSIGLARSAFMFPYQQVYENALGWRGGPGGVCPGYIGTNDVTAILEMLATDSETKILARPRILTLNGETAVIKIMADTVIGLRERREEIAGQVRVTYEAERMETGIHLRVTPTISEDGRITMLLEPAVIRTQASELYPNTFIDPQKRSAMTTVTVGDEETVVIGGLIRTEDEKVVRKIPILGDIPLLGLAFRKKKVETSDRELIFFITPHVVREKVSSTETSGSAVRPPRVPPQPEGQGSPDSQRQREAEVKRAIREAQILVEPREKEVVERGTRVERSKNQLLYEEALARYKLINGWKPLE